MTNYHVTVTEINDDINIYPDATKVEIKENKIYVEFEDRQESHHLHETNEIVIKTNHQ